MKLEQQVVSLELAKKLKELGVKQESLYFWCQQEGQNPAVIPKGKAKRILTWHKQIVSAFTVAELGEILLTTKHHFMPSYSSQSDGVGWYYMMRDHMILADTEADARAKMLIYLIENNLLNK